MRLSRVFFGSAALFLSALALVVASNLATVAAQEDTPAFHSEAPKQPLPPTMDPAQFPEPVVRNSYAVAAKVKKVLYQQPCYCHCDRSQGHGSLLDCFVSKHASVCGTCIKEAFYAYEQTKAGKSPAQVRTAIKRGDWESVDLSKYAQPVK